jgi:hypothetical protein
MGLTKNKKGIFFIGMTIVILTLFFVSYTFFSQTSERKAIQNRIETMNSFLFSIEQDVPRQIHTSGFRIIFLLEKRIIDKGGYITDVNESFQEAFFNGTIEGTTSEEIQILMNGVKFSDIQDGINQKANKISAELIFIDPEFSIKQEDPWNVMIELETKLSLKDLSNLVSWNRTSVFVALVPIEGFEDPIYPIENNNPSTTNKINKTVYASFDSSNVLLHAQNTFYVANSDAPSFLDRLEGKISSSNAQGIESLAVPKLTCPSGLSLITFPNTQCM